MSRMPQLPVETLVQGLTEDEASIVRAAFYKGRLRSGKPFKRVTTFFEGQANYVWRWLAFDYAGFAPHNCMPVTADFEVMDAFDVRDGKVDRSLPYETGLRPRAEAYRAEGKRLLEVIKRAERNLPVTLQAGSMQWARAFGVI
jgi:hypothetical protein